MLPSSDPTGYNYDTGPPNKTTCSKIHCNFKQNHHLKEMQEAIPKKILYQIIRDHFEAKKQKLLFLGYELQNFLKDGLSPYPKQLNFVENMLKKVSCPHRKLYI